MHAIPRVPQAWHPRVAHLPCLVKRLETEDDIAFWDRLLSTILPELDARWAAEAGRARRLHVGLFRVSTWRRPHQSRWILGGGFAAPDAYTPHADQDADWAVWLGRERSEVAWREHDEREPSLRRRGDYTVRISVPSRTARHDQAAVAASWRPQAPWRTDRGERAMGSWYGFRRLEAGWTFTTQQDF